MADTTNYSGNWNGNGKPGASFFTSAWYNSAARFCASVTAARTRSSSSSTSPEDTTWGSILMERIIPRPSAVACTIPPPAETVTVCCASWDCISDSRPCICCPSWSRLDKSAMCRKLPVAQGARKLLQQLEIECVGCGVQRRILLAQRLEPLGVGALGGEPFTARRRRGGARRLAAHRHAYAHRLRPMPADHLRQRVTLAIDAFGVMGVTQREGDDGPRHRRELRFRHQRRDHRVVGAHVGDDAGPECTEPVEGGWTLLR